jgi:hypothetical protein
MKNILLAITLGLTLGACDGSSSNVETPANCTELFGATFCDSLVGEDGHDGAQGQDGVDGKDGIAGTNGVDGKSCTVTEVENGVEIACEDGSSSIVLNGQDGTDGEDGENGTDGSDGQDGESFFYGTIDPCGPQTANGLDEVLLEFNDSSIYAVYASGGRIHLTKLTPGTYVTTDGTNCVFTIDENGDYVE